MAFMNYFLIKQFNHVTFFVYILVILWLSIVICLVFYCVDQQLWFVIVLIFTVQFLLKNLDIKYIFFSEWLLCLLHFLLWLTNEVCETYCFCSVSYYITPGNVLLFYVSFSLLLLFLLFFHTFLSARFLVDALIKLYETL